MSVAFVFRCGLPVAFFFLPSGLFLGAVRHMTVVGNMVQYCTKYIITQCIIMSNAAFLPNRENATSVMKILFSRINLECGEVLRGDQINRMNSNAQCRKIGVKRGYPFLCMATIFFP
ncbi:hypothetical protein DESC_740162 [Desulfosarcina cetonica]|nr:hypothetical protein DESC_740162 [Desulfosarcina cetonica]